MVTVNQGCVFCLNATGVMHQVTQAGRKQLSNDSQHISILFFKDKSEGTQVSWKIQTDILSIPHLDRGRCKNTSKKSNYNSSK